MARKTVVKVLKAFTSGGVNYNPGDVHDLDSAEFQEELSRWPEGAVSGRLNNGFLVYDTVEVDTPAPKKPAIVKDKEPKPPATPDAP